MELDELKSLSDKELLKLEKRYVDRLKYYYSSENERVYHLIVDELNERKSSKQSTSIKKGK